jgi:hypothetical protein
MFTRAHLHTLSWATYLHTKVLNSILILFPYFSMHLPCRFLHLISTTKMLYAFLTSPVFGTCPANFVFLVSTASVMSCDKYRVSTKQLYTFKTIQKRNAAYLEIHTHTSRQKNSQSFVSNGQGGFRCCALPLYATTFENGYHTTDELVYSAVSKERACNSCATCISQTISHGTTQPNNISLPHSLS